MHASERRWGAALALAGGLVVAFWWWRLVLTASGPGMATVDLRLFFYPIYHALFPRVAQGELPLWNPYQLCGAPWLGSPQGALFYPPHVLYLFLPTHVALALLGVLHLLVVALGMALLARRLGLGPAAALLAALLVTLRGTLRSWFLAPPLLEAGAWLPLGCVAILDLARAPRPRSVALLAVVAAASWLAGGPQATVYVHYGWAAFVPAALLAAGAPARRWLAVPLLAASGVAVGALLAGVQLAPSLEMAREGVRATAALDFRRLFPFGLPQFELAGFLYEQTLGNGQRFGVIGLALVAAAPFVRRRRAVAVWALLVGVVAFGMAVGPASPLFDAYLVLPALGWFRNPVHLNLLTDFCFALAAGVALDGIAAGADDAPADAPPGPARGVFAALAIVFGVARARWHELAPALAAGLAVAMALGGARIRRLAAPALVAVIAGHLFAAPPNTSLLPFDRATASAYDGATDLYERLRALQGSGRVWIMHGLMIPTELAPKLASRHHVRSIDDYESITTRRQAEYFTWLLEGRTDPANPTVIFAGMLTSGIASRAPDRLAGRRRLLDLAGVRIVAAPAALDATPAVRAIVAASSLRSVPSPRPDYVLYENPHAVPRAYVVHGVEAAPPPAALLARLSDPRFDPLAVSYVEGPVPGPSAAAPRGHPATIVRDEAEVVEIEATLAAPGLVVLADAVYPGWVVTVDGVPATIVPTNHLFRGVAVGAGTHRIRFAYRPASVLAGAIASALGACAIAGLWWAGRRRADAGAGQAGAARTIWAA